MKKLLRLTLLSTLLFLSSYAGFGQCQQVIIDRTDAIKKDTFLYCKNSWYRSSLNAKYPIDYTINWLYKNEIIGNSQYVTPVQEGWYKTTIQKGSCISSDSIYIIMDKNLKVNFNPIEYYCGFEKEIIISSNNKSYSIRKLVARLSWEINEVKIEKNSIKLNIANAPRESPAVILSTTFSSSCIFDADTIYFIPTPNCTAWTTLKGKVYRDKNKNGKLDTDERPLANTKVQVGVYTVFTDKDGNYTIYLPIGDYSVTIPDINYQESIIPSTEKYDLSITENSTISDKDFASYWDNIHDLSVTVASSRSRPGLSHTIYVNVENKGDISEIYNVTGSTNSEFEFENASNNGYFDEDCKCVKWDNLALDKDKRQFLSANFFVPTNSEMGRLVKDSASIASLNGDINLANNYDVEFSNVLNSYDPNDKLVSATPFRSDKGIDADSKLSYTIRFQNTGTDTAYHVVVKDTLSPNLDLSTLKFLGASHPYTLEVDNYRVLTVRFSNIMLPDSIINEPKSHGYLKFSIYPVQNAAEGTCIENYAGIYFDYNLPVITNTTQSIVSKEQITFTQETALFKKSFKVFPNPANGVLKVENEIEPISSLELLDLSGKPIFKTSQSILNIQDVPSGIYQLKIQTASGIWFEKVVVKQ